MFEIALIPSSYPHSGITHLQGDHLPAPGFSFWAVRRQLPHCCIMLNIDDTHKFSFPSIPGNSVTNDVSYFFLLLIHTKFKNSPFLYMTCKLIFTDA